MQLIEIHIDQDTSNQPESLLLEFLSSNIDDDRQVVISYNNARQLRDRLSVYLHRIADASSDAKDTA